MGLIFPPCHVHFAAGKTVGLIASEQKQVWQSVRTPPGRALAAGACRGEAAAAAAGLVVSLSVAAGQGSKGRPGEAAAAGLIVHPSVAVGQGRRGQGRRGQPVEAAATGLIVCLSIVAGQGSRGRPGDTAAAGLVVRLSDGQSPQGRAAAAGLRLVVDQLSVGPSPPDHSKKSACVGLIFLPCHIHFAAGKGSGCPGEAAAAGLVISKSSYDYTRLFH